MEKEKKHLFDKPENVKRLLIIFFSLVGLLFVLDFFVDTHGHFPFETWPVFYAIFGFVACVILVLVSRYVLRPLVKRREDYYE